MNDDDSQPSCGLAKQHDGQETIDDGTSGAVGVYREEMKEPKQAQSEKQATAEEEESCPRGRCSLSCLRAFLDSNQFPLLILLSIFAAKAYPPLGAELVHPEITATWIAVILIFLISGLCLRLEEFATAFQRLYFNAFVHLYNFGFISVTVFGISRFLKHVGAINSALADGLVICSCLPMAINVVIVLTTAAGGDEAAAIFNTTFGNVIGIFLAPALILMYLGTSGDITLAEVFYKLTLRVILPLVVGLCLRRASEGVAKIVTVHKKKLKRCQEWSLVFIVYTVFCQTFQDGTDAGAQDIILTVVIQCVLLVSFMGISWVTMGFLDFAKDPKLRVMGLFGCCGKTISLGVPLINSIYENDPQRGLYTLPLLIWHPLQLLMGSYLATRLAVYIKEQEAAENHSVPGATESSIGDAADVEAAAENESAEGNA